MSAEYSDSEDLVEATADHQKPKNLIRSQYKDVMIKVDKDIYYLDRLQLALKSGYFEKLFTQDYSDKNYDLIEIPLIDTDTFSAVVDIIYGQTLHSVLNSNNYVSLLMAMDYLQMDIDEKTYGEFVRKEFWSSDSASNKAFELYHFIAENSNYEYLFPVIFKYLSKHLEIRQDLCDILSVRSHHLIEIILQWEFRSHVEKFALGNVCVKWICHDVENRLRYAIDLVNAIRYRFEPSVEIPREDFKLQLSAINENTKIDTVSKHFRKLLMYTSGENCLSTVDESELHPTKDELRCKCSECVSDFEYPEKRVFKPNLKLETFLKNGNFFDITIKAGEKIYKLHRSVLKSASSYFQEMLSAEYSEIIAQCDGIPNLPSKDKVYFIDEIDSTIFDIVVDHIYLGKMEFACDIIVGLFKAIHILKIDSLMKSCRSWIKDHSEELCVEDVIKILNFTHENKVYEDLNRFLLSKYIVDSWPEIDNLPQFADLFKAIAPIEKIDRSNKTKTYLLDKVDQKTFKLIIDFIYFNIIDIGDDNVVSILKASEVFKMEELMKKCVDFLDVRARKIKLSSEDIIEVINFARRNIEYEVLHIIYLIKHLMEWPQVDKSLFCWMSFDSLENLLMSPTLYFDDPRKILDICSEWVIHDTVNRYCLIPRIALAISGNRMVDSDEYSTASPPDLNQCTRDFVKEKLWEVLSSTSVLPTVVLPRSEMKKPKTEQPMFITSHMHRRYRILNANWDEIASFCFSNRIDLKMFNTMSATMINDNLFILCRIETFNRQSFFHVYNFSSNKLFSLASDSRIDKKGMYSTLQYTLLSCLDEIYCCLEDGEILKYSMILNRWMKFSESEPDKERMCFTSDGNMLYRMYMISQADMRTTFIMEAYNFEQNSWVSSPHLPELSVSRPEYKNADEYKVLHSLNFLNDYGFAVQIEVKGEIYLLGNQALEWRSMGFLPYNYVGTFLSECSIITVDESNNMLYVVNNQLHLFSRSNQNWILKKKWPMLETGFFLHSEMLPYGRIIAIHKSAARS